MLHVNNVLVLYLRTWNSWQPASAWSCALLTYSDVMPNQTRGNL